MLARLVRRFVLQSHFQSLHLLETTEHSANGFYSRMVI